MFNAVLLFSPPLPLEALFFPWGPIVATPSFLLYEVSPRWKTGHPPSPVSRALLRVSGSSPFHIFVRPLLAPFCFCEGAAPFVAQPMVNLLLFPSCGRRHRSRAGISLQMVGSPHWVFGMTVFPPHASPFPPLFVFSIFRSFNPPSSSGSQSMGGLPFARRLKNGTACLSVARSITLRRFFFCAPMTVSSVSETFPLGQWTTPLLVPSPPSPLSPLRLDSSLRTRVQTPVPRQPDPPFLEFPLALSSSPVVFERYDFLGREPSLISLWFVEKIGSFPFIQMDTWARCLSLFKWRFFRYYWSVFPAVLFNYRLGGGGPSPLPTCRPLVEPDPPLACG